MAKQNRRDFLKTSVAGTAGMMVAGSKLSSVQAKEYGWYKGRQLNPDIDNLRVVYIKDTSMMTGDWSSTFSTCNGRVDEDKVKANIDKMACALARNTDVTAAWKAIFLKPDSKQWSEVKAAIKVNGLGSIHPTWATVAQLCEGLKTAGVSLSNITVFDACSGCTSLYNSHVPSGVKVSNGSSFPVTVSGWGTATNVVQNVDILISCAVCKGHSSSYGNFTMTMKNHFGTAKPHHPSSANSIITVNESDAIMGDPGPGVPARQQLAFIDCLWTKEGGPSGSADRDTGMHVMGTLHAAVDYLAAHKVRKEICDYGISSSNTEKLLLGFATQDDVDEILDLNPNTDPDGRGWCDANNWTQTPINPQKKAKLAGTIIELITMGTVSSKLELKKGESISSITIHDVKGRLVRSLALPKSKNSHVRVKWDGKNNNGNSVAHGTYMVKVIGKNSTATSKITIKK